MKALILSGGGAKGAFSIGALKEIRRRRGNLDFDIISGTSTGSLIATLLAADMLDDLERIYKSVDNRDIVNPQNILQNIRRDQAFLMDDSPLQSTINGVLTQAIADNILTSDTILLLTAVSLKTGKITVFHNQEDLTPVEGSKRNYVRVTSRDQLMKAMSASSNQFAFLRPVKMNVGGGSPEQMVDGGVRDTLPTEAVLEINPNPDEIVVISNNPMELFVEPNDFTSPIAALLRGISIFIQDVRENDAAALDVWAKENNKEFILITPIEDLDPENPTGLRFEKQRMADMMLKGERRAKRILDDIEAGVRPVRAARSRSGSRGLNRPGNKKAEAKAEAKAKAEAEAKAKVKVKNPKKHTTSQNDRCQGITEAGKRCKNHVTGRAKFCHLHRS